MHFGGHLGSRVSDLIDGRLPAREADRAWDHVLGCGACRDLVEHERWVKDRLSFGLGVQPPAGLCSSLADLPLVDLPLVDGGRHDRVAEAWSAVGVLESRHRTRRTGWAVVGAGSLSLAVVGVLTLGPGLPSPFNEAPREASIGDAVPDRPTVPAVLRPSLTEIVLEELTRAGTRPDEQAPARTTTPEGQWRGERTPVRVP